MYRAVQASPLRAVMPDPRSFLLQSRLRHKGFLSNLIDNVKQEASKDEELQASVKQFEARLTDVKKNKALNAMKSALKSAKDEIVCQNQAVLSELKEKMAKVQEASGRVAEKISVVSEPVRRIGRKMRPKTTMTMSQLSESPIVANISKNMKRVQETIVDDAEAYRYGGFISREKREAIRQEKLQKAASDAESPKMKENATAGTNIVVHKDSAWRQKWQDFKDNNLLLKGIFGIKQAYDESNNMLVYYARSVTNAISDTFQSFFQESETAHVIREITQLDPEFKIERFLKDAREYIIPEILDAFLKADMAALHMWTGEAVFNMLKANMEAAKKPGHAFEGKILDLRSIEVVTAKIVGDCPVLVISFHTQQVSFMRNLTTGTVVDGKEDHVEAMFYVWALAKQSSADPLTMGWKLIEMAARKANAGW